MRAEPTLQRLDPLGALSARPATVAAAGGTMVFSILVAALTRSEVNRGGLAVLAIALLAASCAALVWFSHPGRAPFLRRSAVLVVMLGGGAVAAAAAASWGSDAMPRDDWAPIALALVILALSPYRPPRELAAFGVLAAVLSGVLAVAQASTFRLGLSPLVYFLVASTPVLALAVAGAAFSASVLASVRRWQGTAATAAAAQTTSLQVGLARGVQQDRVTILNRDVVPFFTAILERGSLSAADNDTAREISSSIRAVMLAEADRSWLDSLVVAGHSSGRSSGALTVSDDQGLARQMTLDQRAAVRALLAAIAAVPQPGARNLRVTLRADGPVCHTVIITDCAAPERAVRAALAPYLAVLRTVFDDVSITVSAPTLTVRFCHDHP